MVELDVGVGKRCEWHGASLTPGPATRLYALLAPMTGPSHMSFTTRAAAEGALGRAI
jgi:hypothetical protein